MQVWIIITPVIGYGGRMDRHINETFFAQWSAEMAYTLGFFFADGSMSLTARGSRYISLETVDRHTLVSIRTAMRSNHKIARRSRAGGHWYRLQIGSRLLFEDLLKLGVSVGKSKTMQPPPVPARYIGDFVRGYFDGDGNVWSGIIHQQRKTKHRIVLTAFTSASHGFIVGLKQLLHMAGCVGGSIYKTDSFSRLQYGSRDSIMLYRLMYSGDTAMFLARKRRVFEAYLETCGRSSIG